MLENKKLGKPSSAILTFGVITVSAFNASIFLLRPPYMMHLSLQIFMEWVWRGSNGFDVSIYIRKQNNKYSGIMIIIKSFFVWTSKIS